MHTTDEKRLIEQAGNGDLAAFEALYRLHSARVHGLCARLCNSRDDAQDATQETFVKAWRALPGFKGDSAFSTWLHRIAFNESMSMKRKYASTQRHLQVVEPEARDDASSISELEQLEHAVARLPERAKEALVLHKIYGYTHEETAEFMGTSVGASKAQVHRAIALLRELIPGPDIDATGPITPHAARSAPSNE